MAAMPNIQDTTLGLKMGHLCTKKTYMNMFAKLKIYIQNMIWWPEEKKNPPINFFSIFLNFYISPIYSVGGRRKKFFFPNETLTPKVHIQSIKKIKNIISSPWAQNNDFQKSHEPTLTYIIQFLGELLPRVNS